MWMYIEIEIYQIIGENRVSTKMTADRQEQKKKLMMPDNKKI